MREERFLFQEETGDVFTVNRTGAFVYRLYRAGRAPARIAGLLAGRYRVPKARALDDVRAFLAQLRIHGFIDRR